MSGFMVKLENYTLNILTLFYFLFRFLFLKIIEIFSKKLMEVSYSALNNLFDFAEKRFSYPFVFIVTQFCKLCSAILRFIKLILELPSIFFSLIYEILFYILKGFFRVYDFIVFIILWFFNIPVKLYNITLKIFSWFLILPSSIINKFKNLFFILNSLLYFFINSIKSLKDFIILLLILVRNFKLEDLKKVKNINKESVYSFIIWFFKVKLGFNETFRTQLHTFLIKNEKAVKLFLSCIFFKITQIPVFTDGFLED